MMSRRVALNLVVFLILFFIMVGWAVRNVVSVEQIDRPYPLSATFSNAFGVLPNAEVTYLGVTYGRVSKVERVEGGVRVDMEIKRNSKIPDGSTANIYRKSAIGEQYVDFSPPPNHGEGGPYYKSGTVLPLERTTVPLEFSELLRSASALISAVPPEAVSTLLQEASAGLEGRTDSLRELTQSGDRLAATLAARTEALDRLATNNTRLTSVVTDHRGSLGEAITDLRAVADSLKNARGDVSVLLARGSQLLGLTADLVAKHKGNLDCDLKTLELVIDETTTPYRLNGLRALLEFGPTAFDQVWDTRDVETAGPHPGVWVRVGFIANPTYNRPDQYVPPKELPPPREVTPCVSPLSSTSADYRPARNVRGTGAMPATGQSAAVAGGLGMLAAGLVLWQVRRAEREQ